MKIRILLVLALAMTSLACEKEVKEARLHPPSGDLQTAIAPAPQQ